MPARHGSPSQPARIHHIFRSCLEDLTEPIYSSCYQPPAGACTTIQYESLTRGYIESQGYDIVANFGDQFSDLKGGYADQTVEIPNRCTTFRSRHAPRPVRPGRTARPRRT